MNFQNDAPFRPTRFAENKILTSILDGTYPAGSNLPGERSLAKQFGVTRPTIREILQRLAKEGWIEIRHGKPTMVNDYWGKGGLGMLRTMANYSGFFPEGFTLNLLEFRLNLLPYCARAATENDPEIFLDHLGRAVELEDDARAYAVYDWKLQVLMVKHCKNVIYPLIWNDFSEVYKRLAYQYFSLAVARESSSAYFKTFLKTVKNNCKGVEKVTRDAFEESITIWKQVRKNKETEDETGKN